MEEKIKEIFDKIDRIIRGCLSENPIPFEKSKFKKDYEKLKEEYK